jgi:hypothetical protein
VLLLCISRCATADLSLDELMTGFSRVNSAQARFEEHKTLALLTAPLVLDGTLYYRAPDYLKKEVLHPARSSFEISGDRIYIETQQEQRMLPLDSHPLIRAFAESYRATLAGDRATLEQHFETELSGNMEFWTLRLLPRGEPVQERIDSIVLTGRGNRIRTIATLETSGDTTLMTIVPDGE